MTRRLLCASAASLLLVLSACSGDDKPSASGTTSTTAAAADGGTSEPTPVEAGRQTFRLLDAGAEPRRRLRFGLEEGAEATVDMVLDMGLAQRISGQALPQVDLPPVIMGMTLAVREVTADRSTLAVAITSSRVGPGAADAVRQRLEQSLGSFTGYKLTLEVDGRGRVLAAGDEIPKGIPEELGQFLSQFNQQLGAIVTPFPEEAVGAGARWEVVAPAELGEVELTQTTVYTLAGFEGDRPRLTLTQTQTAEPGPGDFPGLPEGAEVEIVSWEVAGSGELTVDLTLGVPTAMRVDLEGDQAMDITVDGDTTRLDQHLQIGTTLSVQA